MKRNAGYEKLVLVHPDMVKVPSSTTTTTTSTTAPATAVHHNTSPPPDPPSPISPNPQKQFYQLQMMKERLSPSNALIQALSHIHSEISRVLFDPKMSTNERLFTYNQLMTRAHILRKKAHAVFGIHEAVDPALAKRLEEANEMEEEDEAEEEEDEPLIGATAAPAKQKEDRMSRYIHQKIPSSYRDNANKLYSLITRRGEGVINWTQTGELIVKGQRVPNSHITELLADASRLRSKSERPVGADLFYAALKNINPEGRYIRNSSATKRERY